LEKIKTIKKIVIPPLTNVLITNGGSVEEIILLFLETISEIRDKIWMSLTRIN